MFNKKKILFYGPANTKDKASININNYDIVIITNNMCEIFFNKYNVNPSVLIYLISNKHYSFNYYDTIRKYIDKIDIIFTIGIISNNFLIDNLKVDKIHVLENNSTFNMMDYIPLCLTRILMHLEKYKFDKLHIIGCTFYDNPKNMYEKNYQLINLDNDRHNLLINIDYLKYFIKNRNNIIMSDELKDLLVNKNTNNKNLDSKTLLLIYKNKH